MANGYTKIASGTRTGRLVVSGAPSLWLGVDHLLQIEKDSYTETYKRFYFADIEQFTIRIDGRRFTLNVVFGSIVGLLLFLSIMTSAEARTVFAVLAGLFLLPLIYNAWRGPTCVVHITTAVQREQLQSIGRVKQALRLLETVTAAVATAQGSISPDIMRAKVAAQSPLQTSPPPLPQAAMPSGLPTIE